MSRPPHPGRQPAAHVQAMVTSGVQPRSTTPSRQPAPHVLQAMGAAQPHMPAAAAGDRQTAGHVRAAVSAAGRATATVQMAQAAAHPPRELLELYNKIKKRPTSERFIGTVLMALGKDGIDPTMPIHEDRCRRFLNRFDVSNFSKGAMAILSYGHHSFEQVIQAPNDIGGKTWNDIREEVDFERRVAAGPEKSDSQKMLEAEMDTAKMSQGWAGLGGAIDF